MVFNKNISTRVRNALTLHVGSARFALSDSDQKTGVTVDFANSGLTWTIGQKVSLKLTTGDGGGTVTPQPTVSAPEEPTGLTAKPGDRQVTLSWDDPGDASITGYQYQVRRDGSSWGSWTGIPGSGADSTSHNVTGLFDDVVYFFRLAAVNAGGRSWRTDEVRASPNGPPVGTRISLTGFRAMAGDGQVTLTWDNPNAATFRNGRPRVTYRWEYQQRAGSDPWGAWTPIPGFRCRYGSCGTFLGPEEIAIVTGLRNFTTYSFRVRSRPHRIDFKTSQDTHFHLASAPVSATPRAGVAPVRVTPGPGLGELTVEWTQPDPGRWRGQELFQVHWKKSGAQDWNGTDWSLGYGNARWVLDDLEPGTEYTVRVWTSLGHRVLGEATATPGAAAPPPAAPALEYGWASGAQMMLRFDKVLDESSVPPASAFAVSVAGSARSVSSVLVSQDTVTLTLSSPVSADDSGLTVGYTPPSTGKLRLSGGGAAVAAFSDRSVGNDTPPDGGRQERPPPEAVEPPAAEPLTARFTDAPSEHNGTDGFALRVAFSAPVAARAKDAGVQVSGGTLTRAVRVSKRKDLWELRVTPSGSGAVTVTLPATADCAASGAVCTADGRRLETALTHTVQGAVALSVADASAQEGPGATMDFAVTLSRAASGKVTVRYATRNGTAKKDKDYRKAKGTLTFAAGETSKTVSVAVLDDAHDEGTETFRLVLHDAKGAGIADGEAVGTIANSDPLQQDWLARFGRAAASDAIAAVTARLETPRGAGSHLTLAGQRVDLSGTDGGAALQQALTGFASLLGASPEAADPAGTDLPRRWLSDIGPPDRTDGQVRTIDGRQLLMGTSFRAVLGGGTGAQWTSWGQGASVSQFASATPTLSLSGETATGSLGMDYERGRLLTGFAMTHSLGEGTAQGAGRSYVMGSSVTTALPYARLALSDRLSAWGLAGTGSGRLTLDLDGATPERYGADLSMTLAAVGMRGELVTPAEAGGFALALKADAFWVRTESESASTPGGGNLAGARADASRVRAVLDGSRSFALAGGGTLTPSLELGLRNDGGDAETGTGTEIGAGLGYADPSRGLDMALRVHGLAAHAEDGYSEWGVSGSLRLVPGAAGRGLSASLTPSYGVDPGGSERLWAMPDAHALTENDDATLSSRLDTEIGYGLAGPAGLGTLTPYAGLGLAGDDARTWRAGARWEVAPDATLGFEGTLSESAGAAPEQGVMLRSSMRW
ncbi:MAG: fibronectin type III domain-containing protein [Alphaproteobacteria bacterium]|nr:fibronectin type III domain-containing protein [Alphaproteobacteria bacterium]